MLFSICQKPKEEGSNASDRTDLLARVRASRHRESQLASPWPSRGCQRKTILKVGQGGQRSGVKEGIQLGIPGVPSRHNKFTEAAYSKNRPNCGANGNSWIATHLPQLPLDWQMDMGSGGSQMMWRLVMADGSGSRGQDLAK